MEESQQLTAKVGKLLVLPSNEMPTIATVSDMTKLLNNPFFSKAKNGDKVLIYLQAKEAILYDPMANKIVAVGPVNTVTSPAIITPVFPSITPAK